MDAVDKTMWSETRPSERRFLHAALRLLRSPYVDLQREFMDITVELDQRLAARVRLDEARTQNRPED